FTGAVGERRGYFEQADGGTLFLDEIGELRADHQGKLLRVLQEKTFYKVGATRPVSVDVRIVAASNRDLERGVAEGWFREDLYFRLKGLVLRLPPLRDRRHDIAPLATQLLEQAGAEAGRSATLSDAALVDAGGDRGKAALALAGEARLVRAVEVKLAEYHEHLLRAVEGFASAEAAVAACRRRFKNLPDRHFRSLESLVRKKFE